MKNRIISLLLALSMLLPGTLSTAALLSPAPARAAGTATTHYHFEATTASKTENGVTKEAWELNHDRLHTNLFWGDGAYPDSIAALRPSALAVSSATMHLPSGAVSNVELFRMSNTVDTKTYTYNQADEKWVTTSVPYGDSNHNVPRYHYGLPYEVRNNGSIYYKTATESLTITLQDLEPLDTTGIEAANVSMVILQSPSASGLNIPLDRRLEVKVSLDGDTWLDGSAGVRSATLIAGGLFGTTDTQFFRIETDNLLDIEGFNPGDTIQGIRILPEGEDVCSNGMLYINELRVNTYKTEADFEELVKADEITYTTPTDSLRDIAVAEAVRTASVPWTTEETIIIWSPSGSSSGASTANSLTYTAGTPYRGPVYERFNDSSRELFQSLLADKKYDIDEASKVTNSFTVSDGTYTSNHPYGMDCQTFVFNAISRVSRTNAWAVAYTLWATRARLLEGLTPLPFPRYTDNDIIAPTLKKDSSGQTVYAHYAKAKAGDIALHFQSNANNAVHTRLVKKVEVNYSDASRTTINPYTSYIYCTEQAGANTTPYTDEYGNTYYSSSRIEEKYSFYNLLTQGYVIYTLDEYQNNQAEDLRLQAVAGSKTANMSFVDGGVSIAVSSNYRIISHQVTLTRAGSDESLYDSGLQYNIAAFPAAFTYSSATLDNVLKDLPSGEYTLTVSVDSGPFTSLEQITVPNNNIPFEFTIDRENVCDTDKDGVNHESEYGWTPLNKDWFTGQTQNNNGEYSLPAGKYYLTEDLTVPHQGTLTIAANNKVTLCLNGKALKLFPDNTKGTSSNSSILVNGNLTLCDCADTGTIQAGDETTSPGTDNAGVYALYVSPGGQVDMYGGTITNTYARFGSVYIGRPGATQSAVMNMYGGAVSGNRAAETNSYSGITLYYGGVFNMHGGTISYNTSVKNASGIYMAGGSTANIYGGTISKCTSPAAVYISDNATLNMSGGTITGNTSTEYDAVYVASGTFTMTGGEIYGNDVPANRDQVGKSGSGTFTIYDGTVIENSDLYSVTVGSAANGTVSVDKAGGAKNTVVTVTATPDEGYQLEEILVDGSAISGNTFPITGNHEVTATFKELPTFYGANLALGTTLDMNFYYAKTNVTDENSCAKVVRSYADGRADDVRNIPRSQWQTSGDYYKIVYDGLAAKEMCDEIKITIYNSTGAAISKTWTDSIRDFVMRVVDDDTDPDYVAARTMLIDMLNYGAAAQTHFGYATDDLANSLLTAEHLADVTPSAPCEDEREMKNSDNVYGSSLGLENKIVLNFYFTGVKQGMSAKISYTDHYGKTESYTADYTDFVRRGNNYKLSVDGLAVADGNTLVTCTVYNSDGTTVHAQVKDSMNSYLARLKLEYPWMEYVAKFISSTYDYMHRDD